MWEPEETEVRFVHPFQARKEYLCPGCLHEIRSGTGHVVAIPIQGPDLRRHWHKPCWERRRRQ